MNKIREFINWWNRPNKSVFTEYLQAFVIILPIAFVIRTWGYGLYQVPTGSMETTMLRGDRFFSDKFSYTFFSKPKRGDIIAFNTPLFKYSTNKWKFMWQYYVWGPENWTKRTIGLPGEHVEGRIENDSPVIYINGKKLIEPYLNKCTLVPVSENWDPRSYDANFPFDDQPYYRLNGLKIRQIQKLFDQYNIPTQMKPGIIIPENGPVRGSDIFDVHLKDNEYWVMGDNRLGSYDSRGWGVLDGKFIHGKIVYRLYSIDSEDSWFILDLIKHPIDFFKRVRWSRFFNKMSNYYDSKVSEVNFNL